MPRYLNFILALILFFILLPLIFFFIALVFFYDFKNPIYFAKRVGLNFTEFKMFKIRTMVVNAENSGVNSTSDSDSRITPVGKVIRKIKIDELMQLVNVLKGDMNLVGPRPNVLSDVKLYNEVEKKILSVKPGITDFSSIVFSDEGLILKNKPNADLAYNQLIRPWKSRLCLIYIKEKGLILDIKLIFLTILAIIKKEIALNAIHRILKKKKYEGKILEIVKRKEVLKPSMPPEEDV